MDDNSKLIFWRPADGNGRLVFGDAADAAAAPDAVFSADAELPGLDVGGPLRYAARLSSAADLPGLDVAGALSWDANVARPLMGPATSRYQRARGIATGARSRWQHSERVAAAVSARWQIAVGLAVPVTARWQQSQALRSAASARYQHALGLLAQAGSRYQYAAALRAFATGRYQHAQPIAVQARSSYQHMLPLRPAARGRYQIAQPIASPASGRFRGAVPVGIGMRNRYQIAWWPQAGMHRPQLPPGVDPRDPCYDPATLSRLIFEDAWAHDGRLVFVCVGHGVQPPGEAIIVPVRRVYIVINNTYLTRVSDGAPIPVHSMSLSLDAGSWTWGFDATLPGAAQAMVEPTAGGPVELAAFVNGTEFRVLAEEISSERVFLSKQIRVSGRGANARLDSPFAPQQIFANTAMRTTEQLMGDVLTINGVPFGYSVDYRLTPWVVPAGGFVHLGTYISALTAIANAGGGYLRPHPSLQKFDVLHRYPTAPWEPVTPGIILPVAVTTRESITWVEKPDYNRVFVSGQDAGVLGDVRRQGTAFDKAAPMVVDALITDAAAAQQKGLEVLGNTGRQYEVGLRLPVLAQTGVIQPGVYVQYVDGAITRTGIVRSTQVEVGEIDVYQTIGVEVRG